MRLNEHDAQIATAAVQLLERDFADRLEEHPEPTQYAQGLPDETRDALNQHDRVTHLVRKLQTGGFHDLFDWEVELVREGLTRYQRALNDRESHALIADENSRFIEDDEQRQVELRHAGELLDKLPRRRSS